jgi:protein-tyrosine phosphatase
MKILFVCSQNKWRSRTAETIFKDNGNHQIKSAGTEKSARIRLNQEMLYWADLIFVMEKKHKTKILKNFEFDQTDKEIIALDIPDDYQYMDEELIESLNKSVGYYIDNL